MYLDCWDIFTLILYNNLDWLTFHNIDKMLQTRKIDINKTG